MDVTEVIKKNEEVEVPKIENIEKIANDMDNINIEAEAEENLFNNVTDVTEEVEENEEDNLFGNVKKIKSIRQSINEIEDFDVSKEDKKKSGVFGKLRKINGTKKAKADSDIW